MTSDEMFVAAMNLRVKCGLDTTSDELMVIKRSSLYKLFHFLYDIRGDPMGYICWAEISEDALWMMEASGNLPKYPYEWAEGEIVLITDVVMDQKWKKKGFKDLLGLRRNNPHVKYLKRERCQS